MKPSLAGGAIAIVLLILLVVAYSTFFTVYQTRQASRRPANGSWSTPLRVTASSIR